MRPTLIASLVLLAACDRSKEPMSSPSTVPESSAAPAVSAPVSASAPASTPATPTTIDRGDGLIVTVERAGTGDEVHGTSAVTLHYRAFVENAEQPFDSSYDGGVPLDLRLGSGASPRVIDGLARGLVGLRAGTKAKLAIPAALGWGSAGNVGAGVPQDSNLVYEVDVVGVH